MITSSAAFSGGISKSGDDGQGGMMSAGASERILGIVCEEKAVMWHLKLPRIAAMQGPGRAPPPAGDYQQALPRIS